MRIITQDQATEQREAEMERLIQENAKLKAVIEYIGAMDYPEIFEDGEDEING